MQVQMLLFQENCILVPRLCRDSSGVLLFHALIRVQLMWAVPLIGLQLDGHVAL